RRGTKRRRLGSVSAVGMRVAGREGPVVDVADAVRQEVDRAGRALATSRHLSARAAEALTVRQSVREQLTARRVESRTQLRRLRRLDRYDPGRGTRFSTYAPRVVDGELKRHLRDHTWAMHVPRSAQELHLRVRAGVDELRTELGRSPTVAEVADHLAIGEEDV